LSGFYTKITTEPLVNTREETYNSYAEYQSGVIFSTSSDDAIRTRLETRADIVEDEF